MPVFTKYPPNGIPIELIEIHQLNTYLAVAKEGDKLRDNSDLKVNYVDEKILIYSYFKKKSTTDSLKIHDWNLRMERSIIQAPPKLRDMYAQHIRENTDAQISNEEAMEEGEVKNAVECIKD